MNGDNARDQTVGSEPAARQRLMAFAAAPGSPVKLMGTERRLCVGPPGNLFVFGGVLFGAALAVLEDDLQRPVIWSAAQFLGPVRPDELLELHVEVPSSGRTVSQARVVGRVNDRLVFLVSAALGAREEPTERTWDRVPDAPPPEDCQPARLWPHSQAPDTLLETLEMRIVPGKFAEVEPTGRLAERSRAVFWVRARQALPIDISLLALFADFLPYALGKALGGGLGGVSLDNTLRVVRRVETEWILCDASIQAIHAGFAHGDIRLFAQTGELLAIGSQSMNAWPPTTRG